jgi:isopenicillin-N epimerase
LIARDRSPWRLDPSVAFLNHGSYGACPEPVLAEQRAWRDRMEAEPVQFLARELEGLLDDARLEVARFLGADAAGLAFVPNATSGVNAVLGSLRFSPGDELIATDHEYNACLNAHRRAAARDGASVAIAAVPFPIGDPGDAVEAVLAAVTPRTRFALISHVSSPTALILPIEELVHELAVRGIGVLVDGAHAPGMVPLAIDDLARAGMDWYTGNGHKWLCGPKGSGFLWTREERRATTHPVVTSHGANDRRTDRSRYRMEFDWTGTADPTAYLTLPAAIRFIASLTPGGWPEVMATNRAVVKRGRELVLASLGTAAPAPDEMLGAMAAIPLPISVGDGLEAQRRLYDDHRIEVPVSTWPVDAALAPGETPRAELLRISAQLYNVEEDYADLAEAIAKACQSWSKW